MSRAVRVLLAVVAAWAVCGRAAAAAPAVVADVGAWCWFADPRAIEYRGAAVFGWVGDDGSVMVGDSRGRTFALDPRLQRDDHANPSFAIRRDGRLTAFWSAHGGDAIRYRTTTGGSISSWGRTRTGPANPLGGASQYTYPTPVRAGRRLYLFWSGVASTATYAISSDDGETWGPARALFRPDRWPVRYVKYAAAADGIHLAWTVVHPRYVASAVHHAIIRDGVIRREDGTAIGRLGVPLDPLAGAADVVYSPATAGGAWIHDLEIDRRGRPVIAYATFPTVADHTYRIARWNGRWIDEHVTMAGPTFDPLQVPAEDQYSGGVTIDPQDTAVLWLSRRVRGQFEIERWTRTASGWRGAAVTHASRTLNVRPYPVGRGLAWMRGEYPSFLAFRTSIVWLPERRRRAARRPAAAVR